MCAFYTNKDLFRNTARRLWLCSGILKDGRLEPVSYTHLDVYKRQQFVNISIQRRLVSVKVAIYLSEVRVYFGDYSVEFKWLLVKRDYLARLF